VGSSVGSDVQLECRCEASPTPMTSWIRSDGVILLPTPKYQTREEHDSYRTKMKLKITNLEKKDFGSYKCVAKNTLGEKEGLVRLYGMIFLKFYLNFLFFQENNSLRFLLSKTCDSKDLVINKIS
jgi:hypothetical protein